MNAMVVNRGVRVSDAANEGDACPVCLVDSQSRFKTLSCDHVIHEECWNRWGITKANDAGRTKLQVTCPMCRTKSGFNLRSVPTELLREYGLNIRHSDRNTHCSEYWSMARQVCMHDDPDFPRSALHAMCGGFGVGALFGAIAAGVFLTFISSLSPILALFWTGGSPGLFAVELSALTGTCLAVWGLGQYCLEVSCQMAMILFFDVFLER